ncbi:hypothetical protein E2C01_089337 [Portunus trituberculatus]|uniref:Uncharacterized protein n=1 Tax=Portunus trituberculatus TaxID=210409 RepID=A0A5B7J8J0_PORTR|nr:hypothetical protein [Portunus trituberculatus]
MSSDKGSLSQYGKQCTPYQGGPWTIARRPLCSPLGSRRPFRDPATKCSIAACTTACTCTSPARRRADAPRRRQRRSSHLRCGDRAPRINGTGRENMPHRSWTTRLLAFPVWWSFLLFILISIFFFFRI